MNEAPTLGRVYRDTERGDWFKLIRFDETEDAWDILSADDPDELRTGQTAGVDGWFQAETLLARLAAGTVEPA